MARGSMNTRFTLIGMDELMRRMRTLDDNLRNKVAAQAVRAAAGPIIRAAKQRVPSETGMLGASIGQRVKTYRRSAVSISVIGPRSDVQGKKRKEAGWAGKVRQGSRRAEQRKPAYYAHLAEFGTSGHWQAWTMIKPGLIVPVPHYHPGSAGSLFLTQAFESKYGAALDAIKVKIRSALAKAGKL